MKTFLLYIFIFFNLFLLPDLTLAQEQGLKEIVKKNGILIDNIDSKKIASSILKLTNNKDELLKYQNLSWENHEFTSKTSSMKLDKLRKSITTK